MLKDILLYGYIDSYSVGQFIKDTDEVLAENPEEITFRLNTPGGDTDYCVGAISKFSAITVKKKLRVDGKAHSMGLLFCAHSDEVIANEYSQFLCHRIHYPSWIEDDDQAMAGAREKLLKDSNKKFRAALEAKIDVKKFEQITGYTLDDVFNMDGVLDVVLTAQEAKRIGLVDKIEKISMEKKAEFESKLAEIATRHAGVQNKYRLVAASEDGPKTSKTKTMDKITKEALKAENPELYAQLVEEGEKAGAEKERERVAEWNFFMEVDPKGCKEGIASGKAMTSTEKLEFMEKKFRKGAVGAIEEESEKTAVATGKAPTGDGKKTGKGDEKSDRQKELEEFKAGVLAESTALSGAAKK
jgi:ATP-dependent protease ClpP protease subunit